VELDRVDPDAELDERLGGDDACAAGREVRDLLQSRDGRLVVVEDRVGRVGPEEVEADHGEDDHRGAARGDQAVPERRVREDERGRQHRRDAEAAHHAAPDRPEAALHAGRLRIVSSATSSDTSTVPRSRLPPACTPTFHCHPPPNRPHGPSTTVAST
jgi:hypothetical protein